MLRLINFKGIVYCYRPRVLKLNYLGKKHNEAINSKVKHEPRDTEKG